MPAPLSDTQLMERVKDGDARAFAKLVERHQAPIINFFYRHSWDRAWAEDCAQEVFLRVFRAAPNYAPAAKFTTFLYRIARNYLIDHFRSKGSQPRTHSLDASAPGDESGSSLGDRLEGRPQKPEARMHSAELRRALSAAIDQLPPDQREVFLLGEVENVKYADIAAITGVPIGTVKSRMFAAHQKLRELLADLAPMPGRSRRQDDDDENE